MTKRGIYKNCEKCNKLYYEYPYEKGKRRFCSWLCSNKTTGKQVSQTKRSKSGQRVISKSPEKWRHNWAYQNWRSMVFQRDNFKCVFCGKNNLTSLIAHHPKSYKDYPELRLDVDNGITLCRSCHNRLDDGIKSSQY